MGAPCAPTPGSYLPRARLRNAAFDTSDRRAAEVALEGGIDFLALSFVRDSVDLVAARRWLDRRPSGSEVGLIAKIERAEALAAIDGILTDSAGIMVARGDLGIEVPLERLALEQKRLIDLANARGRFVIVATQMLLSMVDSPRPTRAEATDVANAVLDGTDAVMLSEESAVGRYPVEAVRWLDRITATTEAAFDPRSTRERVRAALVGQPVSMEQSVAAAAVALAESVGARAIVTPTHSGLYGTLGRRPSPFVPRGSALTAFPDATPPRSGSGRAGPSGPGPCPAPRPPSSGGRDGRGASTLRGGPRRTHRGLPRRGAAHQPRHPGRGRGVCDMSVSETAPVSR